MKIQELREKSEADLREREKELAEQLFALRLQRVVGQLEKPAKIRAAKRELAQVLTLLGQKQKAS
ncbi:MAG: 50S ribosomal protein L29 [Thermoanaerobaculia bacterium]